MGKLFVLAGIVGGTAVFLTLLITHLQAAPTASNYNNSAILYDSTAGGTLSDQAFEYQAVGKLPTNGGCFIPPDFCPQATQIYSPTLPRTVFNSLSEIEDYAGYAITPTLTPTLNRADGFKLTFTLNIAEEHHTSNDRAGLVVILLADDMKGIEVSFWEDEIWVQNDNDTNNLPLFTHGEGVSFTTKVWVTYELEIIADTYSLSANNTEILSGTVRDYTAWEPPSFGGITAPDPYETPNLIFLGDNSSNGRSQTWIQDITIHYNQYNIYLPTIIK